MKVLILGGTGYLGSRLARDFVNAGHTVTCTKRASSKMIHSEDICGHIRWTSANTHGIEAVMDDMDFDYVINTVCNYGKGGQANNDVTEANLCFPLMVLNSAVRHRIKNFLTIGTGLPDELDIYSFSKKQFSEFGRFYAERSSINFQDIQLEMFYGADEPRNRFLSSVISKMLCGEPVDTTLGTQRRDIICADDVLFAIMTIVGSDLHGYCKIPVGTGKAPTVSEIIDHIWNMTGRKSELYKGAVPMRKNEPDCAADTKIMRSLCDWQPKHWRDGLNDMIDTMRAEQADT